MRLLLDYRPALCARTGVGEYAHQLVRALARLNDRDSVVAFSSSWSDRVSASARAELDGVTIIDRRVPVRVLNFAWHRLSWPPVEWLAGPCDVAHSFHPLLVPTRHAARLVTVHDLDFLTHPEHTSGEIRRDYPVLARAHAHAADRIVVPSRYTAGLVERLLDVAADKVSICPPSVPEWQVSQRAAADDGSRYLLCFGTLEPRKNVGALLAAYEALVTRRKMPRLVLAGRGTPAAAAWLEAIGRPPLAGHVEHRGYVPPEHRQALYEGARMLVMPSLDEGFGLPALEAMSLGLPVVASNRGALPEVIEDAGLLVNPDDTPALSAAIERLLDDEGLAAAYAARGRIRARQFSWERSARLLREAFELAAEAGVQGSRRSLAISP